MVKILDRIIERVDRGADKWASDDSGLFPLISAYVLGILFFPLLIWFYIIGGKR